MESHKSSIVLLSIFIAVLFAFSTVDSAPNNSTAPAVVPSKVNGTSSWSPIKVTIASNGTTSVNKTAPNSEEDCEPEPEPEKPAGGKNTTTVSGQREGKQLSLGDSKDKYKTQEGGAAVPEPEPVNEKVGNTTVSKIGSAPAGDAEKLKGGNSSSTTVAPSTGGAANKIPSSLLWANVIFTTLLASFTYSTL